MLINLLILLVISLHLHNYIHVTKILRLLHVPYTFHLYSMKVIVRLACNLDKVKEAAARAMIIWIIGEYSSVGQIIPKVMPSVLKYLACSFTSEELETKLQILNTVAKVMLLMSLSYPHFAC